MERFVEWYIFARFMLFLLSKFKKPIAPLQVNLWYDYLQLLTGRL